MSQTTIADFPKANYPEQGVAITPNTYDPELSNVNLTLTIAATSATHTGTEVPCVRNNYVGPLVDTPKY